MVPRAVPPIPVELPPPQPESMAKNKTRLMKILRVGFGILNFFPPVFPARNFLLFCEVVVIITRLGMEGQ
jgi:hypothetical protein